MRALIFLMLLSSNVYGQGFIGAAVGFHTHEAELNDFHPYIGYEYGDFSGTVFLNSFKKVSVAALYDLSYRNEGFKIGVKTGLSTGYDRKMQYGNFEYTLPESYFLGEYLIAVFPTFSFYGDENSFDFTMVGNSFNVGYTVRF